MRIKELFLLPDPSVKTIPGASIDGYYCCSYDKVKDKFEGFYMYEWVRMIKEQEIVLESAERRRFGSCDFR